MDSDEVVSGSSMENGGEALAAGLGRGLGGLGRAAGSGLKKALQARGGVRAQLAAEKAAAQRSLDMQNPEGQAHGPLPALLEAHGGEEGFVASPSAALLPSVVEEDTEVATPAAAAPASDELERLRAENAALRRENSTLRETQAEVPEEVEAAVEAPVAAEEAAVPEEAGAAAQEPVAAEEAAVPEEPAAVAEETVAAEEAAGAWQEVEVPEEEGAAAEEPVAAEEAADPEEAGAAAQEPVAAEEASSMPAAPLVAEAAELCSSGDSGNASVAAAEPDDTAAVLAALRAENEALRRQVAGSTPTVKEVEADASAVAEEIVEGGPAGTGELDAGAGGLAAEADPEGEPAGTGELASPAGTALPQVTARAAMLLAKGDSREGPSSDPSPPLAPRLKSQATWPPPTQADAGSPADERSQKVAPKKLKDLREFWGKNSVGFAGPQIGGTRLSKGEAQATLQRLITAGGAVDFDEVRRLRKLIMELE